VGGICVGRINPGFVGGRVEVTKRTGALVGVSPETLTHAVNSKRRNKASVIFRVPVIRFFLWAPNNHRVITPVRGGCNVGIPHTHFNGIRIQDRVAVDLVAHPPVERGLWIAAAVDDLL
jgi:hypothetical protein